MTPEPFEIKRLVTTDIDALLADLCRVLVDSVADGASISFMAPLSQTEAGRFWMQNIRPSVEQGDRHLFGAFVAGKLVGTVQLAVGMPPNQPHRAEISKMVVHPENRRSGIGHALMSAALELARTEGKTLVTLDTRSGDVSEALYRKIGFEIAGTIPDFAYDPDGLSRKPTTLMYRSL